MPGYRADLVAYCQSVEILQKKGIVKVWKDSKAEFFDLKAKNTLCYLPSV